GVPPEVVAERRRTGVATAGQALIASLLTAVLDTGITVRTSARVTLLQELRGRVVLATGGFERDTRLVDAFLRAPVRGVLGAPGARGDGLRMAMGAGAALGNMSEAWWCPATQVPGDSIEGEPLYRMLFAERARPGAIMIDSRGLRFADEAQNHNDVGRALHSFDPAGFRFDRDPSWLIFDAKHRDSYPVGPVQPGTADPDWLPRGHTPAALADLIDVPAGALTETIERFNAAAADGLDPDFGRGSRAFDRLSGDPAADHPTLRPLTKPPYYALRVHPGLGGTKGGPRTDADGRVLHIDGGRIPGLYAAGNAAASPFGLADPGIGATLGQALTFGALAGRAAATD
ncbi:MAG: 3-oxosteroid 1-dehydrogenase, partial [Micromonosporaceae bacterium]|nr:3-oxosteroid 1-dehydrogenase [Micromonosporaceae bacterium]